MPADGTGNPGSRAGRALVGPSEVPEGVPRNSCIPAPSPPSLIFMDKGKDLNENLSLGLGGGSFDTGLLGPEWKTQAQRGGGEEGRRVGRSRKTRRPGGAPLAMQVRPPSGVSTPHPSLPPYPALPTQRLS